MKEGVLTTRYEFVNVLLNGKLLGVYALEENFTPELIESQGRRQGVIIRFNEDLLWDNIATFWSHDLIQEGNLEVTHLWSAEITPFQETKVSEDPVLAAEAQTAMGMLRAFQAGERPLAEILDVELWGRFYAMHDLWSACHGAIWHNLRYYYNPVTALLEPVAFDAEPFRWCDQSQTIINEFVSTQIFDDPQIRSAYARELERLTQPGYIESIQAELEGEMLQLHPALGVEFPQVDLGVDWQALKERSLALSLELQPAQPVRGSYQLAQPVSGETGKPVLHLDLVNLMLLPVDVSGTQATLSGGRMERIGDKGVSVGEKSVMRVENVEMDTVSIGIASKDLSMVTVTGTSIRNARFAALAAYIKKPVFGPAKIEAADMTIVDTKTEAIAQKGSTILLRGEAVEAVDLDVDRLYQEGILGN